MVEGRTPAASGYKMPAEWERHRATWVSWPHNPETWPGAMASIPSVWAELVAALTRGEAVHVLLAPGTSEEAVAAALAAAGAELAGVTLHGVKSNDAWLRDCGPTFVVRGQGAGRETALVDWDYNAWGAKYPPWEDDNRIPRRLAEIIGAPLFHPGLVLEGGSIEVNGAGTLMTTESCLLNPNRNPHLDRDAIERALRDFLGVEHFVWLRQGVVGDDTDGHIDDLSRFVSATCVVTAVEDDATDANYEPLRDNLRRLEKAVDQSGRAFDILTIPMPRPVYWDGRRLPASYANFYIANDTVVVPTFRCDRDSRAIAILESVFPTRRVVGIDAVELVRGLGAFHCVTQQQPT